MWSKIINFWNNERIAAMNYLGLDIGHKNIGIAISQGIIAQSLEKYSFNEYDFEQASNYIAQIIIERKINEIIIGYPINMNNTKSKTSLMVEEFKNILQEKSDIKIVLWDERLTTRVATQVMINANLSRKKRKKFKDQLAAQLILQNYLDFIKNQKEI